MGEELSDFQRKMIQEKKTIDDWATWLAKGIVDVQVDVWQIGSWSLHGQQHMPVSFQGSRPPAEFYQAYPELRQEVPEGFGDGLKRLIVRIDTDKIQEKECYIALFRRNDVDYIHVAGRIVAERGAPAGVLLAFNNRKYLDELMHELSLVADKMKNEQKKKDRDEVLRKVLWEIIKITTGDKIIEAGSRSNNYYHPPLSIPVEIKDIRDIRNK